MANMNSSISMIKLEKIKAQRDRIKRLIINGDGAMLEMPKHETIFPENKAWLVKKGVKIEESKDRDGRPIHFIDISELELNLSEDRKMVLDRENLVDGNLRTTEDSSKGTQR